MDAAAQPTRGNPPTRWGSAYPPPPVWARRAAHLVALTTLPTGLWRLALAAGFHGGYTEAGYAALDVSATGALYLVLLSILIEGLALLTLGLVQPWGEQLPRWIPAVGGWQVRPMAAVLPALAGAVALFVACTPFLTWWSIPHDDLTPIGSIVIGLLYLPLVAWAPLLAAVAVDYHRRHRPGPVGPAHR